MTSAHDRGHIHGSSLPAEALAQAGVPSGMGHYFLTYRNTVVMILSQRLNHLFGYETSDSN
jgi:hypothetical protein